MSLLDSVLSLGGLYAPLRKIVHAHAWETHIEDEWKQKLELVFGRLRHFRDLLLGICLSSGSCRRQDHFCQPNLVHALTLCLDQEQSMIICLGNNCMFRHLRKLGNIVVEELKLHMISGTSKFISRNKQIILFWGGHLAIENPISYTERVIWLYFSEINQDIESTLPFPVYRIT